MMGDVPQIDAAYRAISTLVDGDPEFQAMCQALYGPGYDAERVYRDAYVSKMGPDAADVHVNRPVAPGGSRTQKWALRVGLAGVAAGAVASGSELARGVGEATGKTLPHVHLVPTKLAAKVSGPRRGAIRAGNAGFALTADAIAGKVERRQQRQVTKGIGSASVEEMAKGLLVQTRRATKSVMQHGAGAVDKAPAATADAKATTPAAESKATRAGAMVGQGAQAVAGTPQRAAATAAVAGTAVLGATAAKRKEMTSGHGAQQYYSKSEKVDVEFEGRISKVDKSKRMAFGWANVCKVDGEFVNDKQGDVTIPEDLEDAVYAYNLNGRVGGAMHMRTDGVDVYPDTRQKPGDRPVHVSDLVESVMFTAEKKKAMGLPDDFPEAWWTGYRYTDTPEGEAEWQEVLAGRHPGFSIHGTGVREAVMV